jgi:hypothetical protein
VGVPAYAAMRRPGAMADRMLETLMAGVSPRKYGQVIGDMADTVGVSKSSVGRETIEASERVLKDLIVRDPERLDRHAAPALPTTRRRPPAVLLARGACAPAPRSAGPRASPNTHAIPGQLPSPAAGVSTRPRPALAPGSRPGSPPRARDRAAAGLRPQGRGTSGASGRPRLRPGPAPSDHRRREIR